jgi:hypothetical protein
VFCQFSWGEIQFSPFRRNQAARLYDSSVREQMFEHAVFGSASAFLHYRSIQNRFLKPQFGFKIPLNSINRQVQDHQFTDYPLSEVVTLSWRAEPEATRQIISPILRTGYVDFGHPSLPIYRYLRYFTLDLRLRLEILHTPIMHSRKPMQTRHTGVMFDMP